MANQSFSEKSNYNLIFLLNGLDALSIPEQLNPIEFSIIIRLILKANQLFFPEQFSLPNSHLESKCNINAVTLVKHRSKLVSFRLDGVAEKWLISYQSRGKEHAGIYRINYDLLTIGNEMETKRKQNGNETETKSEENGNLVSNLFPFDFHSSSRNDDDHNITKQNKTELNNNYIRQRDFIKTLLSILPNWTATLDHQTPELLESILSYSDKELVAMWEDIRPRAARLKVYTVLRYIQETLINARKAKQATDSVPPIVDPIESAFKDFDILMNQVFDYKNFLEFGDFPDNVNIYTDGWVDTGKDLLAKPGFRLFLAENHPDMLEAFTKILELVERGA